MKVEPGDWLIIKPGNIHELHITEGKAYLCNGYDDVWKCVLITNNKKRSVWHPAYFFEKTAAPNEKKAIEMLQNKKVKK